MGYTQHKFKGRSHVRDLFLILRGIMKVADITFVMHLYAGNTAYSDVHISIKNKEAYNRLMFLYDKDMIKYATFEYFITEKNIVVKKLLFIIDVGLIYDSYFTRMAVAYNISVALNDLFHGPRREVYTSIKNRMPKFEEAKDRYVRTFVL